MKPCLCPLSLLDPLLLTKDEEAPSLPLVLACWLLSCLLSSPEDDSPDDPFGDDAGGDSELLLSDSEGESRRGALCSDACLGVVSPGTTSARQNHPCQGQFHRGEPWMYAIVSIQSSLSRGDLCIFFRCLGWLFYL